MKIYESDYLVIEHDSTLGAIIEEWKLDFTTEIKGESFRAPLEKLLTEFKKQGLKKWMVDSSELKTLDSDDQKWLEDVFYPNLIESGLEIACLVNNKNILGTIYAKNCLQNLREFRITIEVFNKNEEARKWLAKV